jgi:hypothetical protein
MMPINPADGPLMSGASIPKSGNQAYAGSKAGFPFLPVIVTTAVAITMLQIPLVFKTETDTGFSGNAKANVSARGLAEAGIEEAISDIGRHSLRVGSSTDTLPYLNVGLGRGSYTTRVRAVDGSADRMDVISTGHIGKTSRSIRARMEIIKTRASIPYRTPDFSAWSIQGEPATLYYRSLEERLAGKPWIHPEGEILIPGGGPLKVCGFAVGPDGAMWFLNNAAGGVSTLYKIRPSDLDDNPATPVTARIVGPTGFAVGGDEELRSLAFSTDPVSPRNGVLFAASWKSGRLFELGLDHATATPSVRIRPKGSVGNQDFICEAIAFDTAGALYALGGYANPGGTEASGLWRWSGFSRSVSDVGWGFRLAVDLSSAGKRFRAIAGHPDGHLYAKDDSAWYRLSPDATLPEERVTRLFHEAGGQDAFSFHFGGEFSRINHGAAPDLVHVCHTPSGQPGSATALWVDAESLNAHLRHGDSAPGSGASGICPGSAPEPSAPDSSIQVKILAWEEHPGDLAKVR